MQEAVALSDMRKCVIVEQKTGVNMITKQSTTHFLPSLLNEKNSAPARSSGQTNLGLRTFFRHVLLMDCTLLSPGYTCILTGV